MTDADQTNTANLLQVVADLTEENRKLRLEKVELRAACEAALKSEDRWPGGPMSAAVVDQLRTASTETK